jgi:hypothetical protein
LNSVVAAASGILSSRSDVPSALAAKCGDSELVVLVMHATVDMGEYEILTQNDP